MCVIFTSNRSFYPKHVKTPSVCLTWSFILERVCGDKLVRQNKIAGNTQRYCGCMYSCIPYTRVSIVCFPSFFFFPFGHLNPFLLSPSCIAVTQIRGHMPGSPPRLPFMPSFVISRRPPLGSVSPISPFSPRWVASNLRLPTLYTRYY